MKKILFTFSIITVLAFIFFACAKKENASDQENGALKGGGCTTIQSGLLLYGTGHYLAGQPLTTGYDIFGYNYQARMFNGSWANAYLGRYGFPPYEGDDAAYIAANPTITNSTYAWFWDYRKDNLMMNWNTSWLSNKDCDGDGVLDRHYGFPAYIGSGAWETNHQSGTYEENGQTCNWNYFVKIIAVPADAYEIAGIWYTKKGKVIGPEIWGEFAIIEEVLNDPCQGAHGKLYGSPDHAGLGGW